MSGVSLGRALYVSEGSRAGLFYVTKRSKGAFKHRRLLREKAAYFVTNCLLLCTTLILNVWVLKNLAVGVFK